MAGAGNIESSAVAQSSRSNRTTKMSTSDNEIFSGESRESVKMDELKKMLEAQHKDMKKQLDAIKQKISIQNVAMEMATKAIKLAEESVNRYASTYEKSLAQMVSTMSQTQKDYNRLITTANNILLTSGSLASRAMSLRSGESETMRILRSNYLTDRVSMINVIGESFTKFSGKGVTGSNIAELAIYDQLFKLIAHGFDLASQERLDQIRLYGNQSAITSGASYIRIRNLLNKNFGDTQYLLNGIYNQVSQISATALNVYTNAIKRAEAENAIQQSLAVMYESGISQNTITNWSTAVSGLMAGDLSQLSGASGAALLLALRNSGVSINEVVSGEMSANSIRLIYAEMIRSALSASSRSSNMIYRNAIAQMLGTDVSSLTTSRLEDAYYSLMSMNVSSNADLLKVLNESVNMSDESLTVEQQIKNSVDNIAVKMTTGMVGLGSGIVNSISDLGASILTALIGVATSNLSVMGNNVGAVAGIGVIGVTIAGMLIAMNENKKRIKEMTESMSEADRLLRINESIKDTYGSESASLLSQVESLRASASSIAESDSSGSTSSYSEAQAKGESEADKAEESSQVNPMLTVVKAILRTLTGTENSHRDGGALVSDPVSQEKLIEVSDKLDQINGKIQVSYTNMSGVTTGG